MPSNLSLFEIAQDWANVSNEDVNYFKDQLFKEFPDCPRGPMATQWTPPGPVKSECEEQDTCFGFFSVVDKFWLVFPGKEDVYTIDKENKFVKEK